MKGRIIGFEIKKGIPIVKIEITRQKEEESIQFNQEVEIQ